MKRFVLFVCLVLLSLAMAEEVTEEEDEVSSQEPSTETEESFTKTKEFRAIMGGVAGFWGGVFALGAIYLFAVFAKRMYNPEEAVVKGED